MSGNALMLPASQVPAEGSTGRVTVGRKSWWCPIKTDQPEAIFLHPGKGVKTPSVVDKVRRILTAPQFDALHAALSDPMLQLLVETDLETGLRWGELTELRIKDIDFAGGVLTIARVVVELNPRFHPEGKRFLVKDYPKDKEWRRFRVADHFLDKIKDHIATHSLESDDLLFEHQQPGKPRRRVPTELPDPAILGWTPPNDAGRQYRHGTPTAYGAGRYRCQHCRNSVAA